MRSFVRAMLIMSAAFGLAVPASSGLFAVGLTAVVLTVLGGTTWAGSGLWAIDGAYTRLISPVIGLLWVLIVSWVILSKTPSPRNEW
jgi:hypothetical protein